MCGHSSVVSKSESRMSVSAPLRDFMLSTRGMSGFGGFCSPEGIRVAVPGRTGRVLDVSVFLHACVCACACDGGDDERLQTRTAAHDKFTSLS